MKISVIIPTLNRQEILCETLALLLDQDYPEYELLVIDQTESILPGLQALLAGDPARLRYVRFSGKGASIARNEGLRLATGEIIVFVDDDVIVGRSFLSEHARNYMDMSIGAVTGMILDERHGTAKEALAEFNTRIIGTRELQLGEISEVGWTGAGNLSVRKAMLVQIGGFDEYLPGSYAEDVDLTIRLREAGCRLIADSRIQLVHLAWKEGGGDFRNLKLQDSKAQEAFRCSSYCWLKNRRLFGPLSTCKLLLSAYRQYALNRTTIRTGSVWKKHFIATVELVRVIALLRRTGTSGALNIDKKHRRAAIQSESR